MANRLLVLQEMAHRRYLGADQPGHRRTVAGPPGEGLSAQRGRGGFRFDRSEQEDEQGLREALCERRSVRVRCDDSPHGEVARPCLRTFHTVSPRTPVNSVR